MLYTTKSLTRDGLTYTVEFHQGREDGYRVTAFTIGAAGQTIDAMAQIPTHWTEAARDAEFIKQAPGLTMLADEVYEQGNEVHTHVERRAA
jgi:hypothetical protein